MVEFSNDSNVGYFEVTIDATATDSSIVEVAGYDIVAIEIPATMTGASISFKKGRTPTLVLPIHNVIGSLFTVATTGGARVQDLTVDSFYGAPYLQVVSSGAEDSERVLRFVGLRKIAGS